MKTTIEHLLNPRFEVIADYPGSEFQLGSIIMYGIYPENDQGEKVLFVTLPGLPLQEVWPNRAIFFEFEDFSHLFRPLKWWEKRKKDEMPRYLKIDINQEGKWEYHQIKYWDMDHLIGVVDDFNPRKLEVCDLELWNPEYTYQPCSEEEYLANLKP